MSFIREGDSIKLRDVKTLKRSRHYHPGEIGWLSELMRMVEKSVFIDDLLYVAHPSVSYSASLQDLLIMVYKISGIVWSKYNKQDGEKIIQDICTCFKFYGSLMCEKAQRILEKQHLSTDKYEGIQKVSTALNNINISIKELLIFYNKLPFHEIAKCYSNIYVSKICLSLENIRDCSLVTNVNIGGSYKNISNKNGQNNFRYTLNTMTRSEVTLEQCKKEILSIFIDSAKDVKRNILPLLHKIIEKISLSIADYLQKYDSTNKEFKFLDQCFIMLFGRLAKNSKEIYFDLIDLTLDQLIQISQQILENSKNKQLPEHYYICLLRRVQDLTEFLDRADDRFDRETPEQLKQLLQHLDMHATDTWTLITRHLVNQQDLDGPKMGSLAVHVFIIKQKMTLKILSARNLEPINGTNDCAPYVKVYLIPKPLFKNVTKFQTKTHSRSLFPLFDETFHVLVKPEQQSSGAILFIVKDRVRISQNKCLGQCVLPLKDVSLFDQPPNLNILPQVQLKLKWLLIADDKLFEIVKLRKNNEAAEKFIKKQALHTNALPVNLLNIDKYKLLQVG